MIWSSLELVLGYIETIIRRSDIATVCSGIDAIQLIAPSLPLAEPEQRHLLSAIPIDGIENFPE